MCDITMEEAIARDEMEDIKEENYVVADEANGD